MSLCAFDDKRYVQDDGINKLSYFHKEIDFQVTNKYKCTWKKKDSHGS